LPSPVIVYEVSAAASPGSPVGLSLFTGAAVVYAPEHNHRSFHKSSTNLKSLTTVDQVLKQVNCTSEKCTMHVFTISTQTHNPSMPYSHFGNARTYLQPHYGNGVFGNVYFSAGHH
jgi:hypothetical protein